MSVVDDHEATVAARAADFAVLAKVKQIVEKASKGAVDASYHADFFARLFQEQRGCCYGEESDEEQHSSAFAQLASRAAAVVEHDASSGENPFVKIKGSIIDMIAKSRKEADREGLLRRGDGKDEKRKVLRRCLKSTPLKELQ